MPSPRPAIYEWDFEDLYRHGETTWTRKGPIIRLNYKMSERQLTATLAHELHHVALGGVCESFCAKNERKVAKATAAWLLPDLERLGTELRRRSVATAAIALGVPQYILIDRLTQLSPPERKRLAPVMAAAPAWVEGAMITNEPIAVAS